MTTDPCTYCGEHHHYLHDLVCDNVRTLYPLYDNAVDRKEAEQIAENNFQEEIKALKNDYMILNTSRLNALTVAQKAWQEKEIAEAELHKLRKELNKLRSPGKFIISTSQE